MGSKEYAKQTRRFFKTKKGEYGYGDRFHGIRMPQIREFAKKHSLLSIVETKKLIKSQYHEERLLGLVILINKYNSFKDIKKKQGIFDLYIGCFMYINNWDLVDVSCPHIVGRHLIDKDRSILYVWAKSDHLWTKRIAIVSNWWFIRKGDLKDVFKIAKILLHDEHDLIHKAVGWMLREAYKKDANTTDVFLKKHYKKMPRTMLRYAIEKHKESQRKAYLLGEI